MEQQVAAALGSDAAAEVVRHELLSRLAGRCLMHWHHRLLSTCWTSWSAWVDQRVTWSMAVEQALGHLWQLRLKAVFGEWCAWIELRQAWAEMLLQGLDKMDSVRVEFFFHTWSSHAAEMAGLDSLFRRTVQRLSHGCVTRALKAWLLVARFRMRSRAVGARLIKVHASRKLRRIVAAWLLRAQVTATRKRIEEQAESAMRMAAEEVQAMQIHRDEQLDIQTSELRATETGWQVAVEAATAASVEQMSELETQNQQLLTQLSQAGSAQADKEGQLRDLRKGLADQAAVAQTVKDGQLRDMRKRMQEELAAAESAKEEQLRALHTKMQDAAAAALTVKEEELHELRKEMTDAAPPLPQPDTSKDMEELAAAALAVRSELRAEMESHVREKNVAAAEVRSTLLSRIANTSIVLRRHMLLLRCLQEWRSWASMQVTWGDALGIAVSQVERVRVRQVWQKWAGDIRTVKLERLQAKVMRSRALVASSAQAEAELAAAAAENASAVAALEQQIAAMSPTSAVARLKQETVSLREELSGLHKQLQETQAVNTLTETEMADGHTAEVAALKALVAEKESVANAADAKAQALEMTNEAAAVLEAEIDAKRTASNIEEQKLRHALAAVAVERGQVGSELAEVQKQLQASQTNHSQAEAELAAAAAENASAVAALEQQIAAMSPTSAVARLKQETVSLREELSGVQQQLAVASEQAVVDSAESGMQTDATKSPEVVAQEARAEANATAKVWLERMQSSRAKELQEIADQRAEHAQLEADNAQLRRTAAAGQQEAGKLISSMEIMRKRASEAILAKTEARLQATVLVAWLNHHQRHKRMAVCFKIFARRRNYDAMMFCFEHWLGVFGIQRQETYMGDAADDMLAARVSSDSATSDEDGGAEWHVVESGAGTAVPLAAPAPPNAQQEGEPPLARSMPAQEEEEELQEGIPGEAVACAESEWSKSLTGVLHALEDEEPEEASSPTTPRFLDESFSDDALSADDMTGFREEMEDESFSDSDASQEWEVVHS